MNAAAADLDTFNDVHKLLTGIRDPDIRYSTITDTQVAAADPVAFENIQKSLRSVLSQYEQRTMEVGALDQMVSELTEALRAEEKNHQADIDMWRYESNTLIRMLKSSDGKLETTKQNLDKRAAEIKAVNKAMKDQERDYRNREKVMEKEFLRIIREYEKQGSELTGTQQGAARLATMLSDEVKKHKADNATWEREFNRLRREYDRAGRSVDKLKQEDSLRSLAYGGWKLPDMEEYYKGDVAASYGGAEIDNLLSATPAESIRDLDHQIHQIRTQIEDGEISETEGAMQIADLEIQIEDLVAGEEFRLLEMKQTIADMMTPLERELVKKADYWLARSGDLVADTFYGLNGYDMKRVDNYWTIHRDTTTITSLDTVSVVNEFNLANSGMTKERVKARNPILLTDFFREL